MARQGEKHIARQRIAASQAVGCAILAVMFARDARNVNNLNGDNAASGRSAAN
jgi:hypothetical protein